MADTVSGKTFVFHPKAADTTSKEASLTFGSDGTLDYHTEDNAAKGTWQADGKKLSLQFGADNQELTVLYSDAKLVFSWRLELRAASLTTLFSSDLPSVGL
jgi:hypothetical protein